MISIHHVCCVCAIKLFVDETDFNANWPAHTVLFLSFEHSHDLKQPALMIGPPTTSTIPATATLAAWTTATVRPPAYGSSPSSTSYYCHCSSSSQRHCARWHRHRQRRPDTMQTLLFPALVASTTKVFSASGQICFISIYGVGLGPWEFRSQNDLGESIDRIRERIAGPVQSCPEISQLVLVSRRPLLSTGIVLSSWRILVWPARPSCVSLPNHSCGPYINQTQHTRTHTHTTYAIECLFIYYVQITLYDHDPWTHSQLYTQFSH